jgi:hypothetical protein
LTEKGPGFSEGKIALTNRVNIDLKATVVKKIQSHERRITNIEEHEGMENPDKN